MLVLSRKTDQAVVIGGSGRFEQTVKVTVLDSNGASVRLGFEADKSVPVYRAEIWERMCATNSSEHADGSLARSKAELARWEDDGGRGAWGVSMVQPLTVIRPLGRHPATKKNALPRQEKLRTRAGGTAQKRT